MHQSPFLFGVSVVRNAINDGSFRIKQRLGRSENNPEVELRVKQGVNQKFITAGQTTVGGDGDL